MSYLRNMLYTFTLISGIPRNIVPEIGLERHISFLYYYGDTIYNFAKIPYSNGLEILKQPSFDNTKKTIFYLHGYSEKPGEHRPGDSADMLVKEFLVKHDMNLIVVNYQDLVKHNLIQIGKYAPDMFNLNRNGGYANSVKHVPKIGRALGKFFRNFVKLCNCEDRLHLIGFSLGAHVAHIISKALDKDGKKMARITGIEPAAPLYEFNPTQGHLTQNDAVFVDVIHTNAGQYGWSTPTGHVDFWANKGTAVQPYCDSQNDKSAKCSHYCSVYYYAESINNFDHFPSQSCQNANAWDNKECIYNDVKYFGYHSDKIYNYGSYFFSTNAAYPFGKGNLGLIPN